MSLWKRFRAAAITANRQRYNQFRRRFSAPSTSTPVDISKVTEMAHCFSSTPSLDKIDALFQLGKEEGAFLPPFDDISAHTKAGLDCLTLLIGTPNPGQLLWKAHCKLDGKVVDADELAAGSRFSRLCFAELPANKDFIKSIFDWASQKHLFSNISTLSVSLRQLTISEVYFVMCLLEKSMPVSLRKLTLAIDFEANCLTALQERQKCQEKKIYKWINERGTSKHSSAAECPFKVENPLKKLLAKIVSLPGLKELSLYLANRKLSPLYIGNMDSELLVKDSLNKFCFFSPDLTVRLASKLRSELFSSDNLFNSRNLPCPVLLGATLPSLTALVDSSESVLFHCLSANITSVQSCLVFADNFPRLATLKLALSKEGVSWRALLTCLEHLSRLTVLCVQPSAKVVQNWYRFNRAPNSPTVPPLPTLPSVALFALTYTVTTGGGHDSVDPVAMFQIRQVFPNLKRFVFKLTMQSCHCGYSALKPPRESEKRKCAKAIEKKVVKPLKKKVINCCFTWLNMLIVLYFQFKGIVCKLKIKFGN